MHTLYVCFGRAVLLWSQGRAPVIWQVENLPHDSWNLVPVPSPIGGLQVSCTTIPLSRRTCFKSLLALQM